MGVIQKQSINYTAVHFVGVLIGTLSTVLIYPLNREAYGLARFLIDFSIFMYPFVLLGFESVAIRYFPQLYTSSDSKGNFLGFLLLMVAAGCSLIMVMGFFWGWDILQWLETYAGMNFVSDPLIARYIWLTIPIICFMGISWLFNQYLSNFHKILIPAIFQNLIKVSLPILVLMYHYHLAGIDILAFGIMGHFLLLTALYAVYVYLIGEWRVTFTGMSRYRGHMGGMFSFALYSLFGSLGTLVAFRIDSIMVSTMVDLERNGDFGIASTIAQTIAIPTNAVIAVGAPVIASAWASNNIAKIKEVYSKSSINLLIPGLWIYTGMWACLDALLDLMPGDMDVGQIRSVILLLGAARIIDMATSVNNEIIAYSKYYRFNFLTVMMLAVANVAFNLYFIPAYGMVGAAIATGISLLLYNLAKLVFIWLKMGIQPFSRQTILALAFAAIAYGSVFWWPSIFASWAELLLKSVVVSAVFGFLTLRFGLSEDINAYLRRILSTLKNRIK
jgi:O-antigen/teichoic acid export membrane protein